MNMSKSAEYTPYIFDTQFPQEHAPPGFNTVKIALDSQMRTTLDWKKPIEAARRFQDEGHKIFWDLKFGLFGDLAFPLSNDMQFKALTLAIEYFVGTYWKDFEQSTLGVNFYRGPLNFSKQFKWDLTQKTNWIHWLQEGFSNIDDFRLEMNAKCVDFSESNPEAFPSLANLYCQDVCSAYLTLLAQKLPDKLQPYLSFDASADKDPLLQMQLLNKERFEHFKLIVKGSLIPITELTWETRVPASGLLARFPYPLPPQPTIVWGLCIPSVSARKPSQYQGLTEVIKFFADKKIPYRIIPESMLTAEWEGLDFLVVVPESVSPQGQRKLLGFKAAGGTILNTGETFQQLACQLIID